MRKIVLLALLVFVCAVAIPTAISGQSAQLTHDTRASLTVRVGASSGIIIRPCDPGSGGGGEGVINH